MEHRVAVVASNGNHQLRLDAIEDPGPEQFNVAFRLGAPPETGAACIGDDRASCRRGAPESTPIGLQNYNRIFTNFFMCYNLCAGQMSKSMHPKGPAEGLPQHALATPIATLETSWQFNAGDRRRGARRVLTGYAPRARAGCALQPRPRLAIHLSELGSRAAPRGLSRGA